MSKERVRVSRKTEAASEQGGGQEDATSALVSRAVQSGGSPLPAQTQNLMGSRFGHDFSQVRIHTDAAASESAQALRANAFTVGNDIAFRAGEYAPDSSDGQRLLAHELTHVVQQNGAGPAAGVQAKMEVSQPGDPAEVEAEAVADEVVSGQNAPSSAASVQRQAIQREAAPEEEEEEGKPKV